MKRQIVLGSLVCLAVMVVLLLCWNWLPERIPVEYNARGDVSATLPKPAVVLGMPVLCCLLNVLVICQIQTRIRWSVFSPYLGWMMPVLAVVFCGMILIGSL